MVLLVTVSRQGHTHESACPDFIGGSRSDATKLNCEPSRVTVRRTGYDRIPRLASRAGACGRELALLAFVGGVIYLATRYISVAWGPAPCERPGIGVLVAGVAIASAAVRLRFPVLALLSAALLVGWYPAAGVALALTSYGVAARTRSVRW